LAPTLRAIANGKAVGRVFRNDVVGSAGRALPNATRGYYKYFVVPLPGITYPGPARIIIGAGGEAYFNPSHYMNGQWYRL